MPVKCLIVNCKILTYILLSYVLCIKTNTVLCTKITFKELKLGFYITLWISVAIEAKLATYVNYAQL